MHLLYTADQRGQNRGRKRKSVCARWRNSDGLPASVSHRSDHFREHQRSQQPRFEIETANAELQHAGGTQYASANDISGKDTESESGDFHELMIMNPKRIYGLVAEFESP